ncbi:triple tyrosine motif-containing protein [Flavicella sp.]|uniref:helix-turn-helix and ligand-binding sensor domain-containing protein n=1 Tax=Flavicella sp. TaxID=2957742 RepID=UPI00301B16B3
MLLVAQELPPIENISPEIYDAGNQNWMISQDSNKNIYVANNSGLLEFNGAIWKLHHSPNGTIIRSVKVIEDLVYTGCYMEFGYWKRDPFGNLKYISLIDKLTVPLIKDEHFWNILELDNWILFQSLDRIYLYNLKDETFNVISAKSNRAVIFQVENSIYFQKINDGIFKIENGKSILVTDDAILKNNVLIGAFSIGKKTLFITEKGEFFFYDKNELRKWDITASNELEAKYIYCSIKLKDGSFMLGTTSNGIIHLDSNGNLLRKINKEKGLQNNTVLSIFEDSENNIWLGLDNGISLINLNSPFSVYNDSKGLLGDVYVVKIYKGYFYLGTNQGLFYKPLNSIDDFKLIKNTNGQVWCLKELKNTLFCGHNNGTYIIDENKAVHVSDFAGTWDVKEIDSNENLLLQGNYGGLSILEYSNNKWEFRNNLDGFDISSKSFEFITDNQIIVNHEYNGTFILNIDDEFQSIVVQKNIMAYGLGSSLVKYNDAIIYTSNENKGAVYNYNPENKNFIRNELLTRTFYNKGNEIIGTLVSDPVSESIWGFSDRNIICLSKGKFNKQPRKIEIPISNSFRRNLVVTGFENLTYFEDDIFLVGVSNGYVKLDLNKFKTEEYTIRINAINKALRNAPIESVSLNDTPEFKSDENSLNFSFSVPEFDKYTEVEYQYQLTKISDEWSSWFSKSNVSFENLPSGDYVFSIKARIGNTETNNIEKYSFSISKPWYFSNLMMLFYTLFFLIICFLIHRIYKRYYTVKHQRELMRSERKLKIENLNKEKELMKIRNEHLRRDIDSKNRELGISTMNLIKKNEFLNTIKKELITTKSVSNLKEIIKIIDKNLNSTDDWKLFKKSFTNVEKDFFNNIKIIHPTLTPNDLKLCAFLKLNLSSKEIAQLLNISPKSVEVKRYRLRKKLELPQIANLTDYIFNI